MAKTGLDVAEQPPMEKHVTENVMNEVTELCKVKQLKVTFGQSIKGGIFAGSSAMIGGLLGGPLWVAIGATLGGLFAACTIDSGVKEAEEVIEELTEEERIDLVEELFRNVGPSVRSFNTLARVISVSPEAQETTIKTLRQILLEKGMRLSFEDPESLEKQVTAVRAAGF